MGDFVIVGLALAVLLCWALGAYNRLQALRAQCLHAFASLAACFNQILALVATRSAELNAVPISAEGSSLPDADDTPYAGLMLASQQFAEALQQAQAQPLNAAVLTTLSQAWTRLGKFPLDRIDSALPHAFFLQWTQVSAKTDMALTEFNLRVLNYNDAIQQFPAFMLAKLLGFKPAQPIEV